MTYLQLSAVFLVVAAGGGLLAALVARRAPQPGALGATALLLLLLTAVFDTVMIATGLFHYSTAHLVGVHLGLAPVEDFTYPVAAVLLLPALWTALRARRSRQDTSDAGAEHARRREESA